MHTNNTRDCCCCLFTVVLCVPFLSQVLVIKGTLIVQVGGYMASVNRTDGLIQIATSDCHSSLIRYIVTVHL